MDLLWIPLVLIFLYPVLRYNSSHSVVNDAEITQGPLVTGRASLDSLLAYNLGKPVIVNFWATWCTPCVGELPDIDEVYRSMEGSVAAIAVDIGDPDLEVLLGFRESFSLSMPVVWLNETDAAALKNDWDLSDVLPLTVIFDSNGIEISRAAGVRDADYFRTAVEEGAVPDTSSAVQHPEQELHINVVGSASDSLTQMLLSRSIELAGEEGVDYFDPTIPSDSILIEELYLPDPGYPYAQPCVGTACGQLVRYPAELQQAVQRLSN